MPVIVPAHAREPSSFPTLLTQKHESNFDLNIVFFKVSYLPLDYILCCFEETEDWLISKLFLCLVSQCISRRMQVMHLIWELILHS